MTTCSPPIRSHCSVSNSREPSERHRILPAARGRWVGMRRWSAARPSAAGCAGGGGTNELSSLRLAGCDCSLPASPSRASHATARLVLGVGARWHRGLGGALVWLFLPEVQMVRACGLSPCQFLRTIWTFGHCCLLEAADIPFGLRLLGRPPRFVVRWRSGATRDGHPTARRGSLSSAPPRCVEPQQTIPSRRRYAAGGRT